jgi:hypothetical protein
VKLSQGPASQGRDDAGMTEPHRERLGTAVPVASTHCTVRVDTPVPHVAVQRLYSPTKNSCVRPAQGPAKHSTLASGLEGRLAQCAAAVDCPSSWLKHVTLRDCRPTPHAAEQLPTDVARHSSGC